MAKLVSVILGAKGKAGRELAASGMKHNMMAWKTQKGKTDTRIEFVAICSKCSKEARLAVFKDKKDEWNYEYQGDIFSEVCTGKDYRKPVAAAQTTPAPAPFIPPEWSKPIQRVASVRTVTQWNVYCVSASELLWAATALPGGDVRLPLEGDREIIFRRLLHGDEVHKDDLGPALFVKALINATTVVRQVAARYGSDMEIDDKKTTVAQVLAMCTDALAVIRENSHEDLKEANSAEDPVSDNKIPPGGS